jgi:large subunit ribosomal protein L36
MTLKNVEEAPMKVRASIKSLAAQRGSKVVRRRGRTFVLNPSNPRLKARQG